MIKRGLFHLPLLPTHHHSPLFLSLSLSHPLFFHPPSLCPSLPTNCWIYTSAKLLTFYSLDELVSDVLDLKEGVGIVVVVSLQGKKGTTWWCHQYTNNALIIHSFAHVGRHLLRSQKHWDPACQTWGRCVHDNQTSPASVHTNWKGMKTSITLVTCYNELWNKFSVHSLSSFVVDCSDLIEYSDLYLSCSPIHVHDIINSMVMTRA